MEYVAYFDEVKANPDQKQPRFFFGGIVVPMAEIGLIENELHTLAEKHFGTRELDPAAEFHASFMYSGKGSFKGVHIDVRIDLFRTLAELLAKYSNVGRVYACINTEKYSGADAAARAFMYFCERVHKFLGRTDHAIMIGDLDEEHSKNMIRQFARHRSLGTDWQYGIKIPKIVDSVHFAQSHHSRLLQLADIYLFLVTHGFGSREGWVADRLTEVVKPFNLYANRFKDWPK